MINTPIALKPSITPVNRQVKTGSAIFFLLPSENRMKLVQTLSVVALLTVGFANTAIAQMDHSTHPGAMPIKVATGSQIQMTEGSVKIIDKAGGKVLLSHGPTPDGMPGMTMAYPVKDPAWLDKMSVGQKILFVTAKRGNETIISQFEPSK